MSKFPATAIKTTEASYSTQGGPSGLSSISVGLATFEFDAEIHDTALRCDQIDLDLTDLSALSGKSFTFPVNPEPGYIDGSIYLFGVHVFFLTQRLSFGSAGDETISLRIEGILEFSSSGLVQYEDVLLSFDTVLFFPLRHDQLVSMAQAAIQRAEAQSQRDIGKVMALLAKNSRAKDRLAELNAEVRRVLRERDASIEIEQGPF
ncbi:hypothetical protein [Agrobacterium sp. NPDC089420]|uniref:hypothetical protein n=1 Tax=Agrobacterium sp. NPDC089420 TaxID=3363918 RepID=UPI00384ACD68